MKKLYFFSILTLLLFFTYKSFFFPNNQSSKTILEIKHGSSCEKILKDMIELNLLNGSFYEFYKIFFSKLKLDRKIKSGRFTFEKNQSPYRIFSKIINNLSDDRFIYISAGTTNDKIFKNFILSKDLVIDDNCMNNIEEGSILPGRYNYFAGDSCTDVVSKMTKEMENFLDTMMLEKNCNLSKKEIRILASIVEKETSLEDEKKIVASVFLNRMKKGWKLQADPTAIYGYNKNCGDFIKKVTHMEIKDKNNYNTYFIKGMPIEPICNPSKSSILSIIYPEISEYMFFVRKSYGNGHDFSNSYEEHLKKIQLLKK